MLFILLAAFFAGSETGLFSLNRYRLKHLARHHAGAQRAQELLARPDRLIGILLLGNTFVNIAASSLATVIALRLWGDAGVAIAAGVLTLLLLIFGEVTPKTIAALYPERVAFAVSHLLWVLLRVLAPLVRAINGITNGLLRLFGISPDKVAHHALSGEELRTVVHEAGAVISAPHQRMLLSILDLEKATVEEIMVPRNEVVGIDLDEPWAQVLDQLTATQHTWLPVYQGDIDHVLGFVHMRHFLALQHYGIPGKEEFRGIIREAYFIPEGTPLHTQLLNFQQQRRRIGLVVDEYGEILGLVTLEDILEEIVGEFTTDPAQNVREVHPQPDGTLLVDCTITIRELNRAMGWQLPTEGPRTLNGMITEYLETLPQPGTSFLLGGHPIEVIQTGANAVKTVRIDPARRVEPSARRQRAGGM
ncbi:MAG TPA: HlyC/CorC family transporter [Geothrix sp.]|nr:HlyC/CorC family transporter [Geothrix sp.]